VEPLIRVSIDDVRAARARLSDIPRTPLVRLNADGPGEIFLKLENLQPIGSFKIRGAGNAMRSAGPERLAGGVWTASAGNMAQGVAWHARQMGVRCHVVVPDHAPETKLQAIQRLGATIVKIPHAEWVEILRTKRLDGMTGLFIHPVSDPAVIAGNGTAGLEIVDDLPDVDAVVAAVGGGGLLAGIGVALRALRPEAKIYAAEPETAAPLKRSMERGAASRFDEWTASFVDGAGGKSVLDTMWPLLREYVDASIVVSLDQAARAMRLTAERARVIAEGAGACAVAAALSPELAARGHRKVVAVVSGGNIDLSRFAALTGAASL
jgi:threonine dehydratase